MMYRSKVKATKEECAEILNLHQTACTTPVIALSSAHAMSSGFSGDAWGRLHSRLNELARAYGLKEQAGEYGLDPQTGEFLSVYPISEPSSAKSAEGQR